MMEKKLSSFTKAILINLIFLAMAIVFCDMKYEVSDDFVMQSIIEGAYTSWYDPHLLYSNIILGYGLKALYTLIPGVGWYFVMHIVLCFCSLTAISYIALDSVADRCKRDRQIGLLVVVVFVAFYSNDLYLLVQFTKTAAAATYSGAAFLVYAYNKSWRAGQKLSAIAVGAVLCLTGTMVRKGTMGIALMFLAVIFISDAIYEIKGCRRKAQGNALRPDLPWAKKIVIELGIAIGIYASANGLWILNNSIWDMDEAYVDYRHWNNLRASVTDVSGADDEVLRNELMSMGYTLEDTYMIQSWEFVDRDYFTEDKIREIAAVKKDLSRGSVASADSIIRIVSERGYYRYIVFWGFLIFAAIAFIVDRRNIIGVLVTFGIIVFQIGYCIYNLRILYRVEYCFFYCAAGTIIYLIARSMESRKHIQSEEKSETSISVYVALAIILLARIPLYIPDDSYKKMSDDEYREYVFDVMYESWDYDVRKYRIDLSHRNPYSGLIEYMSNDDEHYYLCDFSTTIQLLYLGYHPWEAMPGGYYNDSYSYIGGVTSYFPGSGMVWENNGVEYNNPYRSIANENIRLVDNYYYLTKYRYYREKYDESANQNLIGKVDGMMIWEIR